MNPIELLRRASETLLKTRGAVKSKFIEQARLDVDEAIRLLDDKPGLPDDDGPEWVFGEGPDMRFYLVRLRYPRCAIALMDDEDDVDDDADALDINEEEWLEVVSWIDKRPRHSSERERILIEAEDAVKRMDKASGIIDDDDEPVGRDIDVNSSAFIDEMKRILPLGGFMTITPSKAAVEAGESFIASPAHVDGNLIIFGETAEDTAGAWARLVRLLAEYDKLACVVRSATGRKRDNGKDIFEMRGYVLGLDDNDAIAFRRLTGSEMFEAQNTCSGCGEPATPDTTLDYPED